MDVDEIEKRYGIKIKRHREPVRPLPLDLDSGDDRRRVLDTARRVMETHADVLTALARR